MGETIYRKYLLNIDDMYKLLIYSEQETEMAKKAVSMNNRLAAELVNLKPSRRTMQLEKCFVKVLESLPEQPIIKDIDVLFNPAYKVDVMKMLASAYKQKKFSLVWPGTYSDGKLIYSEAKNSIGINRQRERRSRPGFSAEARFCQSFTKYAAVSFLSRAGSCPSL